MARYTNRCKDRATQPQEHDSEELKAFAWKTEVSLMKDMFVCPQPMVWNDIYLNLKAAWMTSEDPAIPEPPIPLILAAWFNTSNQDKARRWAETIDWAEEYGFSGLVPSLSKTESFFGD